MSRDNTTSQREEIKKMTRTINCVVLKDGKDGMDVIFLENDKIGINNFVVNACDPQVVRTFSKEVKISLFEYLIRKLGF